MFKFDFDSEALQWGLFEIYAVPFLVLAIAIAVFAYFVSIGKRKMAVTLGIVILLIAILSFARFFI